jgi:hypothetical protein
MKSFSSAIISLNIKINTDYDLSNHKGKSMKRKHCVEEKKEISIFDD